MICNHWKLQSPKYSFSNPTYSQPPIPLQFVITIDPLGLKDSKTFNYIGGLGQLPSGYGGLHDKNS